MQPPKTAVLRRRLDISAYAAQLMQLADCDGDGQLHDVFPWHDDYAIPETTVRAFRTDDAGQLCRNLAVDLDGDGRDEVILWNRHQLWYFASPEAE